MANDWTRLLQEASRHGGPDAMRDFYSNRGKLQGAAAMLLLTGGITLAVKATENFRRARSLRDAQEPAAPQPDALASDPETGEETGSQGEH